MKLNENELFVPYKKYPEKYCVRMGTFDPKRLRITSPGQYIKGRTIVTSVGRYLNDKGEACEPYFEIANQTCFLALSYLENKPKEPEYVNGIKLTYYLTSQDTVKSPTTDEAYTKKIFDGIADFNWKIYEYEASLSREKRTIPDMSRNAYMAAKEEGREYALKPVYEQGNKLDDNKKPIKKNNKNVKDADSQLRTYLKFLTYGEGRDMTCKTQVYGPGNVMDKTGMKYALADKDGKTKPGLAEPVLLWKGIFWGSHGSTQPWGASTQFAVHEVNWTPISFGNGQTRFLKENTALPEEAASDEESSELEGENTEFQNPEDDGKSVQDTLKNALEKQKVEEVPKEEEKELEIEQENEIEVEPTLNVEPEKPKKSKRDEKRKQKR